MQIEPIQQYKHPDYPVRDIIQEHPELLALVPRRWRANPKVLAALAGFTLLAGGCARSKDMYDDHQVIMGRIAPPQVTLSEYEAREVIANEAKRHGIVFQTDKATVKLSVDMSKCQDESGDNRNKSKPKMRTLNLTMDGTDNKHKVDYEYISEQDVEQWQKNCPELKSMWEPHTSTALAGSVREALNKSKPKVKHAVFTASIGHDKETIKTELRRQIQDFIKWLKAEGVI